MTAALRFEVGCPVCDGHLDHLTSSPATPRQTSAMLRCPACEFDVRVSVHLQVCVGADRRHPAEPLIDWIVSRNDTRPDNTGANGDISYVANRLGVSCNALYRYQRHGLTDLAADRLATRLNVHPTMIWPDFHTDRDLEGANASR